MSFVKNAQSIFGEDSWLNGPWKTHQKDWRDLLYDVASALTRTISRQKSYPLPLETYLADIIQVDKQIRIWQAAWLARILPSSNGYGHQDCAVRSYVCTLDDLACMDDHDILLQVECWAIQLLIDCEIWQVLDIDFHDDFQTPSMLFARGTEETRMTMLNDNVSYALKLPLFHCNDDPPEVITEGRCRALLPTWSVAAYKKLNNK